MHPTPPDCECMVTKAFINTVALFMLFVLILNIIGFIALSDKIDKRLTILENGQNQIAVFLMTPGDTHSGPISILKEKGK